MSISHALQALTLVAAAALSAVVAHVVIDIAGDYVLAHDPYDDIAHASRAATLGVAVIAAAVLVLCVVWAALVEARGGRASLGRTASAIAANAPWHFVAAVVSAALVAVPLMGLFDALAAGGRPAFADLFGGSIALAACITIPVASLLGLAVWSIVRLLLRSCDSLVRVLAAVVRIFAIRDAAAPARRAAHVFSCPFHVSSLVSGNAGKRGPPLAV